MQTEFENILNECIGRIEAGEDPKDCLVDYPEQAVELAALLALAMEMYTLSPPQGSAAVALAGQQRMLKKFDEVQAHQVLTPKSIIWEFWTGMLAQLSQTRSRIFPKENKMYRKSLIAIAFVLAFLFTGTTMTAYAAQGSLPGDTLYAVKTKLEDLQINTTWDTTDEVEKSVEYADRRIQEIVELVNSSRQEDIPIGVERFEHHLREALSALDVIAKNDPEQAQELAVILADILAEQSQLIAALLESNPDANPMALSEALTAAYLSSDTVGSVAGITDDDMNDNGDEIADENDDKDGNENDDVDDLSEDDDANGNNDVNDDNDDIVNENDDVDDLSEDDDANGNDDVNENDDDSANGNDDDDGNENDDDSVNDNDDDDGHDNHDDDGHDND